MNTAINPWLTVWFKPRKTASWAQDSSPLYGVVVILLMYIGVTVLGSYFGGSEEVTAKPMSDAHRIGAAIDIWIMPFALLFVLYAVGNYLGGKATIKNIVWVLVWSQLPIIVLSVLTVVMQKSGVDTAAPLLHNKVEHVGGVIVLDPPIPIINTSAMTYFLISTVPLLWSFQILLSGLAAVEHVTVKRAMWFLTLAMIALILLRLPVTLALGDRDLLDVLGLKGIVELK